MLTEREKMMLNYASCRAIGFDYETFTDEEIVQDIDLFIWDEDFVRSEKYYNLLQNRLDSIKAATDKDYFTKHLPIPKYEYAKKDEILEMIDNGISFKDTDIIDELFFYISSSKDRLKKYKHIINFDRMIRNKKYTDCISTHTQNNLLEICGDELKSVAVSAILDNLGINITDSNISDNNIFLGTLIYHLNRLNDRQFKDDEIIKVLLDGIKYGNHNTDYLVKVFEYFDDEYIKQNISNFSPLKLHQAGRLTEDIYQEFIDKADEIMKREEHTLQNIVTDLSLDFLVRNIDKLNPYFFAFQKNALELYKQFPDKVDLEIMYFHNTYLCDEDLEYIKNLLKNRTGEIDLINRKSVYIDGHIPDLVIRRLIDFGMMSSELAKEVFK